MRVRKRLIVWLNARGAVKLAAAILLVCSVVAVFAYEMPTTTTWSFWTLPLSGKTIAIDAGHGGADGGASSKEGLIEKDINLAIALHLRDYLQQAGALVIMTRETDTDLADAATKGLSKRKTEDLKRRVEFVNSRNPDVLISIHMNSIPSTRWTGAQTFYHPRNPDSKTLATFIQNEIKRNLANTERVVLTVDKVYLLKEALPPSALVEVGFLSNPNEARQLADETYQKKVAASMYKGILRYVSGEKLGSP